MAADTAEAVPVPIVVGMLWTSSLVQLVLAPMVPEEILRDVRIVESRD